MERNSLLVWKEHATLAAAGALFAKLAVSGCASNDQASEDWDRLQRRFSWMERCSWSGNWQRITTDPNFPLQSQLLQLRQASEDSPYRLLVEPDFVHHALGQPNDPLLQDSWAHFRLGAAAAWDIGKGSQAVEVAIVDSGVRLASGKVDHEDLPAQRFTLAANLAAPGDQPHDESGHGTRLAGIVAAEWGNGLGIAGMSPLCPVSIYKVFGATNECASSIVREAFTLALRNARQAGRRLVINYSGGCASHSEAFRAYCAELTSHGDLLICCAAGDGGSIFAPASFASQNQAMICVGAAKENGHLADVSSQGREMSLVAPGVRVVSTTLDGRYGRSDGTSMATGFVSGIAALVWSLGFDWPASRVRRILEAATGESMRSSQLGWGMVNAEAAMHLAASGNCF